MSAVGGGIGTGGQDLRINTGQLVFTAQNDALLELNGAATVAGNSTAGAIDIGTIGAGDITIGSVTVDGLSKTGLSSAGASGIQVATPPGGAIQVNELVSATNGPIALTANGASHPCTATGDLTTTGVGTIAVNANAGNLTMVNGTVYTTAGGM